MTQDTEKKVKKVKKKFETEKFYIKAKDDGSLVITEKGVEDEDNSVSKVKIIPNSEDGATIIAKDVKKVTVDGNSVYEDNE